MSSAYRLRPVSDNSPSPSPTASTTSPANSYKQPMGHSPPPNPAQNGHLRRPLSPSSLRDVDLSQLETTDMTHRKYPVPLTGHELMAMFPPVPPDDFPEMRPGPTSGFFLRQERAFFAQAGKEIPEPVKSRPINTSSQLWMNGPAALSSLTIPHHSPVQIVQSSQVPSLHLTPLGTGLCTPPQDSIPPPPLKPEYPSEEYDESWKRPTPCAGRRRAGKHTRRVIVRT
ncbi:hypothetical protein BDZ97DRAFT_1814084 [Flammula alnicola]|nr:hypothetical protein BDZ97DRAFT_1814084 [Flammula alnicola]